MVWTITPDTFDVVVIGSGLPECLVAASLLKAGKSVLIIDAVDTYGTDFASFTPAALHDAVVQEQQQRPPTAAPDLAAPDAVDAAASSGPAPAAAPARAQHVEAEHEHSRPECNPILEPLPSGCKLLRLQQRSLPLSGIRAFAVPGEEGGGLEDRRSYILDLVPKLVYQAEPLVDLLVRCRCHHYLEFKAVEGSYLLQDGALQPVPASRADIFRDRRLGLSEKRALMRFIQGCLEARRGQGHLREALSSSRPLAHILTAEGLSPRLRDVILYGIAMCDTDQEPPTPEAAAAAPSGGGGGTGILTGAGGGSSLELFIGSQGRFGHEGAFMLPCYGSGSVAEAFVRLCAVHGAVTVLRQPVQALVLTEAPAPSSSSAATVAAVDSECGPEPRSSVTDDNAAAVTVAEAAKATIPQSGSRPDHDALEGHLEGDGAGRAPAAAAAGSCVGIVTGAGQLVHCGAVVAGTSTLSCLEGVAAVPAASPPHGYVSRAVVVLDGPVVMPVTHGSGAAAGGTSSAAAAPKSLLTLVVPPCCRDLQASAAAAAAATAAAAAAGSLDSSREAPGNGGGGGGGAGSSISSGGGGLGNPHPVRVLQEGASTCVCPAGRFLLYLSTPATSDSSYDDLWPTLDCLTDTSALRNMTQHPLSSSSSSCPTSTSAHKEASQGNVLPPPPPSSSSSPPRPRALRAWFYRQPVLMHRNAIPAAAAATAATTTTPAGSCASASAAPTESVPLSSASASASASAAGGCLPGGVAALPGPDGGLAGYTQVLRATEAAFRSAFPGVRWLAEVDLSEGQGNGGGEREVHGWHEDDEADDGGGGPVPDSVTADGGGEEDDLAIDELTAAIARLKNG